MSDVSSSLSKNVYSYGDNDNGWKAATADLYVPRKRKTDRLYPQFYNWIEL